uniref:UspA domain-containing protein n=1 Tax=Oryza rufipogon TaxID=4529 RepID=A0A0E0N3D3_ORYRU
MAANPSSPSAGGGGDVSASSPTLPPVRLAAAQAASAAAIHPTSPRYFFSSLAGTNASPHRRIAIAVDLSDESAYAVRWAVQNYLRPGDAVVLLHVRPTSVLYGADWGSIPVSVSDDADGEVAPAASAEELQKKREEDFDAFTSTKAEDLAQPLVDAQIPFKIHVVKDHDMKERLCLEAERLGLSAMIMGSRGFGASRKGGKGRLGSVPTGRQQGQQMSCTLCLRMNLCIMMHLMCRKKTEVMHLERKENVRGLPEAICVFEQCNYCLAVGLLLLYLLDIINWLDQQAAFHFA